jgi:S1-C subfamily serine protease
VLHHPPMRLLASRQYLISGDVIGKRSGEALDSMDAIRRTVRSLATGADMAPEYYHHGERNSAEVTPPESQGLAGDDAEPGGHDPPE